MRFEICWNKEMNEWITHCKIGQTVFLSNKYLGKGLATFFVNVFASADAVI